MTINNPFAYAMQVRHAEKLKHQKPIDETIERNSERVLSSTNNLSAMHDVNNNPFNNPIVKSIKKTTDINKQKLETKRILFELIDSMNAEEFQKFKNDIAYNQLTK
ncbi:hypothetical protein N9T92_01395 [Candidatus Pelagibacter sp.]|nr:hypothetical protein [Candidatus Pelagibacter sp.]